MAVKFFLIFLSVFFVAQTLHGRDTGFKYFKNYSYKEYDHQAQNLGMVQAKNGIIYVANNGGVLVYDGVSWRIIGIPDYAIVRSIVIDKTGDIYIGGKNRIGYLAPDPKGSLKYVSLLDHLDEKHRNFSNVWSIHATTEGIFFRATKSLFRWNYKKMKVWATAGSFKASFVYNGEIILQEEERGFLKVKKDELQPMPGGKTFAGKKVPLFVPYDKNNTPGRQLTGNVSNGFFLYDGKKAEPFPLEPELVDFFKKNRLYQGIRLTSGDYALATRGGLIIMTPGGHLKYVLDKTSGLQDDNIKYVFQDSRDNLWLCLENGISKIEYASPISLHDERSGLSGLVSSVVRHRNDLYVGTTNGLYHLESQLKFRRIPGVSGTCWSLLSIENAILAGTSDGVFHVDKNLKRKVITDRTFVLLPSKRYPGRTWCGTKNGLVALDWINSRWTEGRRFESIAREIRNIVEDKNGNLWLVTSVGGVLKVASPDNKNRSIVTPYGISRGLPEGRGYAAWAAGHVMFATDKGMFRFDEKKKKFIPDPTLGDEFAGGQDSRPVFRIAEDKNKNIWFHSESRNYRAIPGTGGTYTIQSTPFLRIPTIQVNAIYPDPVGTAVWFAGIEGLIRYDKTVKKDYSQDFLTLVRKVSINKKLIFEGYNNKTGIESTPPVPVIDYKDRKNLHIEFAAPFFEVETATQYRYLLEGQDDFWSDWNLESNTDFTILDFGKYTFRVQARNVYRHPGREAAFHFTILPPWYKTWWAFAIYTIAFFLLVFSIVKWQSGKLEREKRRLEHIVKERTKEIDEKNRQLEKQTLTLQDQSEKLKEMDEVKSRFFANISHEFRTPLTLIMGPLEKMLSKSSDRDQGKELKMMLRSSQRLLRLINRLLDLSKLDSGKMKLNVLMKNIIPFIKITVSAFEALALQNRVDLNLDVEEDEVFLSFDPEKLEEVLCNLLINALKFTPPGGKVTVSTRRGRAEGDSFANGYFELSVRDTGVGISRDKLARIFDRFYQTGDSKQSNHRGSGIGLALTKELVLLHRGKIDVHSSGGEDSGTEFVIRLPLGDRRPGPGEGDGGPETGVIPKKFLDIDNRYMVEDEESEAVETQESPEKNGKSRDKNIVLVVEDNADVRKYIRGPLEPHYTVVEARDGREGIDKAKEIIPDLIVSDIMMPEVDGYELCRVLKKEVKTSHIPIVLLTAKASDQSVIEGLETGADDYITKPFNTRILITRIKNLIELRLHLQQKIQKQMLLQPAEISVSSVDREFIKELQKTIEAHLADPEFHVEALSEKLYMNRVTLYRKVTALTGESPTQFIRSYRLKRAAQLLRDNAGNVSEVALDVGFSNLGYFTRCFKEKFHQLPSTYQASESK